MGGALLPHHRIWVNPSRNSAFLGLYALHVRDGVLHCASRQAILCCSPLSTVRSDGNGDPSPGRTVKEHSREELIAFFRSIQTSIAMASPRPPTRTSRKQSPPDPFEEADRRKPSYDEHRDAQPREQNLEDMKVAELRALARARRMKGYSKLKKSELIDRLKGV